MKVHKIKSQTPKIASQNAKIVQQQYLQHQTQPDTVAFKSMPYNNTYVKTQRLINRIFNRNLCDCNLKMMEGVQQGLKSFEGLSLKQIAFALTDLHSINMISGCTRHCLHCYANAQPFIKRYPYEDIKQICDDIKELENRTGAKPCYHHGEGYIDLFFDADGLDCHLYDRDGKKHNYVEIAKMIYEATGYKPVFDTNGWDTMEKQEVAEEYVRKLLENNNYQNFHQINISINPFNPRYVKALNSGYPAKMLYRPFKKIGFETDSVKSKKEQDDLQKARELYTTYVKNTANALITFKPLLDKPNFGVIIRVLENDITNMKGFRTEDFATTLAHIYNELNLYCLCGDITEKELQLYEKHLNSVNTGLFTSGRMEKFYKVRNNKSLKDIDKIDRERENSVTRLEKIKETGKLSSGRLIYLKMISPDGRVFLYDNYKIIPTDIQLKTSNPKLPKPFQINVEDFVLTEEMMDCI